MRLADDWSDFGEVKAFCEVTAKLFVKSRFSVAQGLAV